MAILLSLPITPQSNATSALPLESTDLPSESRNDRTYEAPAICPSQLISHSGGKTLHSKTVPENHKDLKNGAQTRKELFLRGNEGSRRRKRYENANFLNVPNRQPPLPSDWEVYPTYPIHHNVPYYLAPLWDSKFRQEVEDRKTNKPASLSRGKVPQNLKLALKKAKGARPLLQELENEIRTFILQSRNAISSNAAGIAQKEIDSEDEEIVFIGRDKERGSITMSDEADLASDQIFSMEKLTLKSKPENSDRFTRWLLHELAEYYGLESRSENKENNYGNADGNGRNVIIGFKYGRESHPPEAKGSEVLSTTNEMVNMPRPLWCLI